MNYVLFSSFQCTSHTGFFNDIIGVLPMWILVAALTVGIGLVLIALLGQYKSESAELAWSQLDL